MASWDIFCSVVDNYGDIGVTWRLARQLAAEHGQAVRLWVDEPQAFARICPRADPAAHVQCLDGVEVRAWGRPWAPVAAADVVIEAFACELPEAHRQAMRERKRPSLWLNLEYLSAEEWIGSCHALPSLQACGLSKYFFFPGSASPVAACCARPACWNVGAVSRPPSRSRMSFSPPSACGGRLASD